MDIIKSSNSWNGFKDKLDKLGLDAEGRNEKADAFKELTPLQLLTNSSTSTKTADIWY